MLLGVAGLTLGVGCGAGLEAMPGVFEPILRATLFALSFGLCTHLYYDPSERTLFAIMLGIFGIVWALLLAYAFAREPARNRAIDHHLQQQIERDSAERTRYISEDNRLA